MKQQVLTTARILKQPLYGFIAIVTSIGLGVLYYFLTLSIMPFSVVSEMIGSAFLVTSVSLTFVIAILAGVNISMIIFKIKGAALINVKKSGSSTTFGSILTVFTPGCPACTTPLAAILGTVGGMAALPLLGLEFKLLSVGALLFSIFWLTKKLNQPNSCQR